MHLMQDVNITKTEATVKGGKMWFERMKADHKNEILSGALEVAKK